MQTSSETFRGAFTKLIWEQVQRNAIYKSQAMRGNEAINAADLFGMKLIKQVRLYQRGELILLRRMILNVS